MQEVLTEKTTSKKLSFRASDSDEKSLPIENSALEKFTALLRNVTKPNKIVIFEHSDEKSLPIESLRQTSSPLDKHRDQAKQNCHFER